ncbi:hypothetical protein KSB_16890 [Ktedonobacter robiniae]|uniref:DUF2029 domain-containing protein n=1 Tax=Ktedonobacter robiniae TaxID=2778365 RepID=A0ABQ3UKJ0_9CHLR|nr:hypothetical protein KSB_16890 [Ktedonobacter robiniae]
MVRYQGLLQIVMQHKIPDIRYSLIGPSFALPLVWIGRKLGNPYGWTISYNQILFSFTLLVSFFLLRKRIDRALLRKFYLLLIIGSMFTAHLAFFYGEVFTALLVGFGVLIASLRSDLPVAWLAVALGVANTPATLGGLVLLVLKKVFDNKRLRYALVFLGGLALIGLVNWLQHGNPLNGGYTDDHGIKTIMPYSSLPGFSYPFVFGVLSLTLSFGKGLLFFAPGLLLPVRKTLLRWQQQKQVLLYQVYTLWIAFIIGLVLVYARWWAWSGAIFWGPRFLLFASIPASFALAIRIHDRKEASLAVNFLTLVIFVFSVWVCIDGAVYQWAAAWHMPSVCTQNNYNLEMMCYYIPEFSALWLPFTQHYVLNIQQKLFLGIILVTATYIAFPLFLQTVWQSWNFLKKYGKEHFTPTIWRI